MNRSSTDVSAPASPFGNLEFLLDLDDRPDPRWRKIFAVSLGVHLVSFGLFMSSSGFVSSNLRPVPSRQVVPLYLPPQLLTQKARNHQQPSPSVDVASLTSPAPSTPACAPF